MNGNFKSKEWEHMLMFRPAARTDLSSSFAVMNNKLQNCSATKLLSSRTSRTSNVFLLIPNWIKLKNLSGPWTHYNKTFRNSIQVNTCSFDALVTASWKYWCILSINVGTWCWVWQKTQFISQTMQTSNWFGCDTVWEWLAPLPHIKKDPGSIPNWVNHLSFSLCLHGFCPGPYNVQSHMFRSTGG